MTRIRTLHAGTAVALASWLATNPADAQPHSWISSAGTGTSCTRSSPCNSFFAAQNVTDAGGVISVLESGDFGGITISKSLTIRAEGTDGGNTSIAEGGDVIFVQAGANDVVTLEGLHIGGFSVELQSAGQFHVVRCVITNGNVAVNAGIRFAPSSPSKLSVTDTVIHNMGSGTGGGIVVKPLAGGSAQVALERVTVNGNAFGIVADGSTSTAGINMTIADSMIANNAHDGIIATTPSGGAPIGVMVSNSKSVNNAFGIRSIGTNVTVRARNSDIIGNTTGLSFSGGGALLTFGNNAVRANGSDGVFSGSLVLQ